jgi:hypothetical protein
LALYIPAGRRRRNTVVLVAVAAVLGLGIGWVSGRASAPSITAKVASVRIDGRNLATRLAALPIEYEQALADPGADTVQGGVLDTLDGLQTETIRLLNRAPWVRPDRRAAVLDSFAAVRDAAKTTKPAAEFTQDIETAATAVRETFGA